MEHFSTILSYFKIEMLVQFGYEALIFVDSHI